jgi:predicted porin
MNRKQLRLTLAALAAGILPAAPAAAADSVELYGVLDTGIARVEHSLNFDPNHPVEIIPYANAPGMHSVVGMYNGGLSASRWGIRGTEDMGNGMKAIFDLESAINVRTVRCRMLRLRWRSTAPKART